MKRIVAVIILLMATSPAFAQWDSMDATITSTLTSIADSSFVKNLGTFTLNDSTLTSNEVSGNIAMKNVSDNNTGLFAALHIDADGQLTEADADSLITMPVVALALETGTGYKKVLLSGFVRNDSWAWTIGGFIYASTTTGTLTQTAPSAAGDQVQKVGIATHADRMWFNPGNLNIAEVAE